MARHAWRWMLGGIGLVLVLLMLEGPVARKPAAPPAAKPRKIIGQTTQRVLDLAPALAAGGVLVDNAAEAEEGGLAAYSQAYRHSVAALAGIAVDQKMAVYRAQHDDLPATHAEFMDAIIAPGTPDEIRLPLLPHYQEYAFDPARKRLVVVEFPARRAAP
jgi:hypothetical protein